MNAYVFGAGASHAYSESPTGVLPPLAKDVFSAYSRLAISGDRYVRVGAIVNYIRDTRGVDPFDFSGWNEYIEDVLTELEEAIASSAKDPDAIDQKWIQMQKAYTEMVFLFSSILNEIQNGPLCGAYQALIRGTSPNDALITFNWDCLLDRALFELGDWKPTVGYGIAFRALFDDGWQPTLPGNSNRYLLKLHGSTNWLVPLRSFNLRTKRMTFWNPDVDPAERPIYCFVRSKDRYVTYQDRGRSGYEPFSYFYYPPNLPLAPLRHLGDRVLLSASISPDMPEHGSVVRVKEMNESMPLIVPPVRNKDFGVLHGLLEDVWTMARVALRSAERITIIGYSFPPTDTRAMSLFSEAILGRRDPVSVELVDPYPDALAARLSELFGQSITLTVRRTTFERFVGGAGGT